MIQKRFEWRKSKVRRKKITPLLGILLVWIVSLALVFSSSCMCFVDEEEDNWWEVVEKVDQIVDPEGECFYSDYNFGMDYEWTCNMNRKCCFETKGTVGHLKYYSSCTKNCDKCNALCSDPVPEEDEEDEEDDYYDY